MNRILHLLCITLLVFFTTCDRPESPSPQPQEFGYLSMNVALQIEASPASGRVAAVSPDDFIVTIHHEDGSVFQQWEDYTDVPEEVQLPTGTYYVTATNLAEPEDAAFEQPWYYGESDVFTIDKEELETIDVECTLANCKISFSYSQNVLDNFTNWDATATIDDGNGTGEFLEWLQNDPAEGYFLTDLPIDIEVYLEYEKEFEPDELITRTFNHTISTPEPAIHYYVTVDAVLEDGKISINIIVNDEFETVEIPLGEEVIPETVTDIDGNEYPTVQIGDQLWMSENLRVTQLNDGTPIDDFQNYTAIPRFTWYNHDDNNKYPYGGMYNWYAVETGNLCPSGWHIPTIDEYTTLRDYLGGVSIAGGKLKSTDYWDTPNEGADNSSGFYGLPGGFYDSAVDIEFYSLGQQGYFWTANEGPSASYGYNFRLVYYTSSLLGGPTAKHFAISVRCIKD